jgi:hypothetical protein
MNPPTGVIARSVLSDEASPYSGGDCFALLAMTSAKIIL